MKAVFICMIFSWVFPVCQSRAQTRWYLEALGGANSSLSKIGSQGSRPGLHKYNLNGPFYGLLAGYRIGTYLYLESGILKPVCGVSFKLKDPAGNGTYKRTYEISTFLAPLLVRKNFSVRKQKFFIRLGGAFNFLDPDTFPDEITSWPAPHIETAYRQYTGSDIYVCLIAGAGYTRWINTRRIKRVAEVNMSIMYAEGLTKMMGQWVDYSFDGETRYTHHIYSNGSFLSVQLGLRLYTAYFKKAAKFPRPARREIN